jgi:hypothetical protein
VTLDGAKEIAIWRRLVRLGSASIFANAALKGKGCPIIGQIGVEVGETAIVAVIRRRYDPFCTCACIAQKIVDIRQRRALPSPWSGGVWRNARTMFAGRIKEAWRQR